MSPPVFSPVRYLFHNKKYSSYVGMRQPSAHCFIDGSPLELKIVPLSPVDVAPTFIIDQRNPAINFPVCVISCRLGLLLKSKMYKCSLLDMSSELKLLLLQSNFSISGILSKTPSKDLIFILEMLSSFAFDTSETSTILSLFVSKFVSKYCMNFNSSPAGFSGM